VPLPKEALLAIKISLYFLLGITNVPPENLQFLTQEGVILDDDKTLSDYQINPTVARAQAPFELRLVSR